MSRLLLLSSEFPPGPGGIGTHAYQLALGLQKLDWEVAALANQDYATKESIERFNEQQSFAVESFPRSRHPSIKGIAGWKRWEAIRRAVRRSNPDVIVASGDRLIWLAALFTILYRTPWVAVEHGRAPVGWQRRLKKAALHRADAVISVSEYTAGRLLGAGIRCRRLEVIPNGGSPEAFHGLPEDEIESYRRTLPVPPRAKIILTVGHVSERKGQDVIIRALARMRAKGLEVHYLVAGLPTKRGPFEDLAARLRVSDLVHFRGAVDDSELLRLFNACDVFAMTSRHDSAGHFEGYGIAVVEASLCGKPSVVTANCGLSEAVRDGETGLTVPENDDSAAAEALSSLLTDEARRRRMGAAARSVALSSQTWSRRIEAYDAVLRDVAREGKRRN